MNYDHQVDDAAYGLAWMLQGRKVSVRTMRRLLSSDHRDFDSGSMPMRKETAMRQHKICFALNDEKSVVTLLERLKDDATLTYTIIRASQYVVEIVFQKDHDLLSTLPYIAYRIFADLKAVGGGWKIVGPLCQGTNTLPHNSNNNHLDFAMSKYPSGTWRCFQAGCMKTQSYDESNHMTYRDFQTLVAKGQVSKGHEWATDPNKPLRPELTGDITYADQKRVPESQKDNLLKRLQSLETELEKRKSRTDQLEDLRSKFDAMSQELSDAKTQLHELKDLPRTADAVFRFLAGIGFQDHPVAEQREFLNHMSKLKTELKRAGFGSWD